jgi:hypothetical protein
VRLDHLMAFEFQIHADESDHARLVIDDQNAFDLQRR